MKRDARIGLAVVLVLGLAVTMLIGRALYNRNANLAGAPTSLPGIGEKGETAASYSPDMARVDGADAARAGTFDYAPESPDADRHNSALQRFLDDQARATPDRPDRGPVTASTGSSTARGTADPAGNRTAPRPGTTPPPRPRPDDAFDHEEAPHPAAGGYGYTVVAGDNIWKISSKVYGDGKFTQKIIEANKGLNAQKIKPGMVLLIPVLPNRPARMKLPAFADAKNVKPETKPGPLPASGTSTRPTGGAPGGSTTHKVAAGEILGVIAMKYYGTAGPRTIQAIADANPGLDPAKLKIGQVLVLPARK